MVGTGRTANQIISQIKATQIHAENAARRRLAKLRAKQEKKQETTEPMDFPHWIQAVADDLRAKGIKVIPVPAEQNNGEKALRVDFGESEMVQTIASFEQDYEKKYLSRFRQPEKVNVAEIPACQFTFF